MQRPERLTTTEAVAEVVWALAHGEGLTTHDVAELTGMKRQGAYKLLCRLSCSHHIPIYRDEETGVWQVLALRETA